MQCPWTMDPTPTSVIDLPIKLNYLSKMGTMNYEINIKKKMFSIQFKTMYNSVDAHC